MAAKSGRHLPASVARMSEREERDLFGPRRLPKHLPRVKPLSRIEKRLIESAVQIETEYPDSVLYQHTVFCQTGLPYRDPGDNVRIWQRSQGAVCLEVQAGRALHPELYEFVDIGLPWGTKPRLILAHLNSEALKHGSPEIYVGDSLTCFAKDVRGFKHGREICAFKDQLGRLSAALVRLAMTKERHRAGDPSIFSFPRSLVRIAALCDYVSQTTVFETQ
jgi:hypothetical protein